MNKQNFVRFLVENKVLTFGDFVTKSGRNTPYFFNLGNLHTGNAINEIGEYYANAVRENFGTQVENLFGPAYKAIPLAIAAASALAYNHNVNVSYTFNRKEVKDHGEGGWLVGDDYLNVGQGQEIRVVILEDVTTAGTSIREVVPGLRALPGVKVCGLLVGLDRMERGKGAQAALVELQEEFGIKTAAISDFNDVLEFVKINEGSEKIPKGTLQKMHMYREKYGA